MPYRVGQPQGIAPTKNAISWRATTRDCPYETFLVPTLCVGMHARTLRVLQHGNLKV